MSEWLEILGKAIGEEWGNRMPIAALATVDRSGNPRVRHVVCRKFDPDGTILITSDGRSEKHLHIAGNPHVELAFWLPGKRQQFRIAGEVMIDPDRVVVWREMPPLGRAMFFWPSPGIARDAKDVFPSSSSDPNPPESFQVLRLVPHEVDHLDLNPHPHRRRRWRQLENWAVSELNP